jgi:hypothetical protein
MLFEPSLVYDWWVFWVKRYLAIRMPLEVPEDAVYCFQVTLLGDARYADSRDVSSRMSSLPISTAHCNTPISSW